NGRLTGASTRAKVGIGVQGGAADSRLVIRDNFIGNKDAYSRQRGSDAPVAGAQGHGVYLDMTDCWGVIIRDNIFAGNVVAPVFESSPGNIYSRTDISGNQLAGAQYGFHTTRLRGVTSFGAGKSKINAGNTSRTVNAPCVPGDQVQITPIDID